MTKNEPARSTNSHITLVAHTNQDELLQHANASNLGGGIGNRFFFLLVKRSKELPFGGGRDEFSEELLSNLRLAVTFGREERDIPISEKPENGRGSAADLWRVIYSDLSSGSAGLFGAITGRAEAYVRRFATLYAALDRSPEVKISHLLAGLALWDYSKQSSYLIFRDRTGDEIADQILDALHSAGSEGLSRTEIYNLFNRNIRSARIRAALLQLKRDGWARVEESETGKPGPHEERWYAATPSN
jgi:hypothetical protein